MESEEEQASEGALAPAGALRHAAAAPPGLAPSGREQPGVEGDESSEESEAKASAAGAPEPALPPAAPAGAVGADGPHGEQGPRADPAPPAKPGGGEQRDAVTTARQGAPALGSSPTPLLGLPPAAAPPAPLPAPRATAPAGAAPPALASSLDADASYGWLATAVPLSLVEAPRAPSAASRASSSAENQPPARRPAAGARPAPGALQGVLAGEGARASAAPAPARAPAAAPAAGESGESAARTGGAEARAELEARARLEMEGTLARIETHFKARAGRGSRLRLRLPAGMRGALGPGEPPVPAPACWDARALPLCMRPPPGCSDLHVHRRLKDARRRHAGAAARRRRSRPRAWPRRRSATRSPRCWPPSSARLPPRPPPRTPRLQPHSAPPPRAPSAPSPAWAARSRPHKARLAGGRFFQCCSTVLRRSAGLEVARHGAHLGGPVLSYRGVSELSPRVARV